MRVKKSRNKIFGVELTSAEQKAMEMEIRRQIYEFNNKNLNEIDAMILWHLHEEFGFGKKRLLHFYETFTNRMKDLSEQYLTDTTDLPRLYQYKLKEYGIDIEELNKKERMIN